MSTTNYNFIFIFILKDNPLLVNLMNTFDTFISKIIRVLVVCSNEDHQKAMIWIVPNILKLA